MTFRPDIIAAFRAKGLRCTPQRYAILEYVMRCGEHPTAEEVYRAINRRIPRASRATVYKNLREMAQAGLIQELTVRSDAVRFEANMKPHHHFICERCGKVEDIEWFDVPKLKQRQAVGLRKIHRFELVLRGLCEACLLSRVQPPEPSGHTSVAR